MICHVLPTTSPTATPTTSTLSDLTKRIPQQRQRSIRVLQQQAYDLCSTNANAGDVILSPTLHPSLSSNHLSLQQCTYPTSAMNSGVSSNSLFFSSAFLCLPQAPLLSALSLPLRCSPVNCRSLRGQYRAGRARERNDFDDGLQSVPNRTVFTYFL